MSERKITIDVPSLARVEGEGALHLKIEKGALQHLQFKIYEPPRFFEKFLEGRHYTEGSGYSRSNLWYLPCGISSQCR